MDRSVPTASACPDLIVVYPGAGNLNLCAYRTGLGTKTLLWQERANVSANVDPVAELAPLLARHPLRLETPSALVADPANGGFLLLQAPAEACRDQAWVARQLELALPYPVQELCWRARAGASQVEIFWLPRTWVHSQAETLAKLGLRLDEIYPRASVWRAEAGRSMSQQPCLLLEGDALHVFEANLVRRSAALPEDAEAAAQAQQLERLALASNAAPVVRKVPLESQETLAQRMLALWLDGNEAIHLAQGRWAVWRPLVALAAGIAVAVVIAAVALSWRNSALETALDGLTREQRKLAPIEQKFAEMERSVRSDRKYVTAARALDKSVPPVDALNRISAALPDKYWVQHLQIKGETLDVAGRGGSSEEVVRLLGKKGIAAGASVATNPPGSQDKPDADAFSVRVALNKLGSEGVR